VLPRPYTLVAFHAHPDDEALLTGGTLARAAAEGHRVVLVVATAGEAGLADQPAGVDLGTVRVKELTRSAEALGVHRVVTWDYADSGSAPPFDPAGFAAADVEAAALRLAAVLREERADVLLSYDPAGGYGHPDHVQVHRVGARAAALAGTPSVLQATVDRDALLRVAKVLRRLRRLPEGFSSASLAGAYTPRAALTHRVDVRRHALAKRRALAAHVTQASGGADVRTLAVLLRLPRPVFRAALGREWFVEPGRPTGRPLLDDVFATVRG
jgi:LmbE family N-acetylglucosaminyl deacetylase